MKMKALLPLIGASAILLSLVGCQAEEGCTDPLACNFNPIAEDDDGSCYVAGDPCEDNDPATTNTFWDESCDCVVVNSEFGCIDSEACNYDITASVDNGSCTYPGDSCDDGLASTIDDVLDSNCECSGVNADTGCTDSNACNYSASANIDDGSCYYVGDACDDGSELTFDDVYDENCDCNGTPPCDFNASGNIPLEVYLPGFGPGSWEESGIIIFPAEVWAEPGFADAFLGNGTLANPGLLWSWNNTSELGEYSYLAYLGGYELGADFSEAFELPGNASGEFVVVWFDSWGISNFGNMVISCETNGYEFINTPMPNQPTGSPGQLTEIYSLIVY